MTFFYACIHSQAAKRRAEAGEEVSEEALAKDAEAALSGNMLKHKELRGTAWSIMILCFSAVLREGLESFVFLGEILICLVVKQRFCLVASVWCRQLSSYSVLSRHEANSRFHASLLCSHNVSKYNSYTCM
jgi:hypothetical protein